LSFHDIELIHHLCYPIDKQLISNLIAKSWM